MRLTRGHQACQLTEACNVAMLGKVSPQGEDGPGGDHAHRSGKPQATPEPYSESARLSLPDDDRLTVCVTDRNIGTNDPIRSPGTG